MRGAGLALPCTCARSAALGRRCGMGRREKPPEGYTPGTPAPWPACTWADEVGASKALRAGADGTACGPGPPGQARPQRGQGAGGGQL